MFGSSLSKVQRLVEKKKDGELVKLAGGKDIETRLAAIAGLGKVRGEAGFNALVALLRDPEPRIRAAVASAMGEFGDSKLRAHIEHLLKSEADAKVAAALRDALSRIKDKA